MLLTIQKSNNNIIIIAKRKSSYKLACRFILNHLSYLFYWLFTFNSKVLIFLQLKKEAKDSDFVHLAYKQVYNRAD